MGDQCSLRNLNLIAKGLSKMPPFHGTGSKMKLPVHIQLRGMTHSDALQASAREHTHKLDDSAQRLNIE